MNTVERAIKVKNAAKYINRATSEQKNKILNSIKEILSSNVDEILEQNQKDIESAKNNGMPEHLIDRLTLNYDRINSMALAIDELINLADPVSEVVSGWMRPNGLKIEKIRVPIGVVGIIFEARPNVSVDAATICIKSGNAVLLRGGKESIKTNTILVELMKKAIAKNGISSDIVELVTDTTRESANEMMKMHGILDVLIPRGSAGLISSVASNSNVPVIETGTGNCHIYVDDSADIDMAVDIVVNAKTSRPSVCNAAESLVVHKNVASLFLGKLKSEFDKYNVKLVGCSESQKILPDIDLANDEDYYTEYLGYKMSVKVVDCLDEAIEHINKYSSKHSEAIITSDYKSSEYFLKTIDSAAVYVNASTRFTDGSEFGLGAEIGISTQKLHARGPMSIRELTTQKFIVRGNGQVR